MSGASLFQVTREDHEGTAVVILRGELDMGTVPQAREMLQAVCDEGKSAVIDMADLSFLDSTGISLFVAIWKRLTAQGCLLILAAPQEPVRRVLDITKMELIMPVCDTQTEAIGAMRDRRPVG